MKIKMIVVPCIMLVFSLGCSIGLSNNETVLENGTVVSAEEQEMLESLRPQAVDIFAQVLGEDRARSIDSNETVSIDSFEREELDQRLRELMEAEIGPDYERFIVEGDFGERVFETSSDSASRAIDVTDGQDPIYTYRMVYNCKLATIIQ
ncbi:MAG: hypothetical protein ACLFR1_12115 [Spirochaetia bacterium]